MPSPVYSKAEDPFRINAGLIDAKVADLFARGNQIEGATDRRYALVRQASVRVGNGTAYGRQDVVFMDVETGAEYSGEAIVLADETGVRGLRLSGDFTIE